MHKMSSSKIFDSRAKEYDEWYERHRAIYSSELKAVKAFNCHRAVEIGIGTGRFTRGTGIIVGVDPSIEMLKLAPKSVHLIQGVGEALPLRSKSFDCSIFIVTLCFLDNPEEALREAVRVSERLLICMVPRESPWGKLYSNLAERGHPFYSHAKFYTVKEVIDLASKLGAKLNKIYATLKNPPGEEVYEEPVAVTPQEAEKYGFVCMEFHVR